MTSGPSNENPRQEREHLLPTQQPAQQRGRKRAPLVEVTNLAVVGGRARATAKRAALRPHLAGSAAKQRAAALASAARDRLLGRRRSLGSSLVSTRRASPRDRRSQAGRQHRLAQKQQGQHKAQQRVRGSRSQQRIEARQGASSAQLTTSSQPLSGVTTLRLPLTTPCDDDDKAQLPCESVAALPAMPCERAAGAASEAGVASCRSDSESSSSNGGGGGGGSSIGRAHDVVGSERGSSARADDGSRSFSGRKRPAGEGASPAERAADEAHICRERARGEPSCVQAEADTGGNVARGEEEHRGDASRGKAMVVEDALTTTRGAASAASHGASDLTQQPVREPQGVRGASPSAAALPSTSTAVPAPLPAVLPGEAASLPQQAGRAVAGRAGRGATVRDIDSSPDPQLCGRYVADIYGHLRAAEVRHCRALWRLRGGRDVGEGCMGKWKGGDGGMRSGHLLVSYLTKPVLLCLSPPVRVPPISLPPPLRRGPPVRTVQQRSQPRADYMEKVQRDVNSGMRTILVDWLVEVAEEYKLVPDTLYLTCAYLDSFLSAHTVPRSQLQLLGISCMLIASKFEEIYAPQVDEFCYITDNTYTRHEVLQMESRVLNHLAFDLSKPTTKSFLRRYIRVAQASLKDPSLKLEFLSNFFSELALTDYSCLRFKPSCLAASAVLLAKLTLFPTLPPWTAALAACSGYACADLRECVACLHALHSSNGRAPPTAVHQKYCQAKFMAVASIPLPALPPEPHASRHSPAH
ncbi:unnamed protein product [Closterium sp. Yama58-4]|nr:unnamed protein product [Closterium sp. Yama58-4]